MIFPEALDEVYVLPFGFKETDQAMGSLEGNINQRSHHSMWRPEGGG